MGLTEEKPAQNYCFSNSFNLEIVHYHKETRNSGHTVNENTLASLISVASFSLPVCRDVTYEHQTDAHTQGIVSLNNNNDDTDNKLAAASFLFSF